MQMCQQPQTRTVIFDERKPIPFLDKQILIKGWNTFPPETELLTEWTSTRPWKAEDREEHRRRCAKAQEKVRAEYCDLLAKHESRIANNIDPWCDRQEPELPEDRFHPWDDWGTIQSRVDREAKDTPDPEPMETDDEPSKKKRCDELQQVIREANAKPPKKRRGKSKRKIRHTPNNNAGQSRWMVRRCRIRNS